MKSIVNRYPLISYYIFALLLSGLILATLYATGLAETLFFLGTFGSGLAAILVTALISGAAGGAAAGKFIDLGLEDELLKEIGDNLGPGTSAVVTLVDFEQVDQAMVELDKFAGGHIMRHTLSDEVYAKLSEAVED